jgi:hypothetical protein
MPGGDQTGPTGMGAMTGRGAGYCSGSPVPGYMNWIPGRGFRGGRGRGWRHRHYATDVPARQWGARGHGIPNAPAFASSIADRGQEIELLQRRLEDLKTMLEDVSRRIGQLAAESPAREG